MSRLYLLKILEIHGIVTLFSLTLFSTGKKESITPPLVFFQVFFKNGQRYGADILWVSVWINVTYNGVIHLWRPQKMTNFLTLPPNPHHPQKLTIDLLFKNNRIRKHVTNFKTPPSPFRVDLINVWSLFGKLQGYWSWGSVFMSMAWLIQFNVSVSEKH